MTHLPQLVGFTVASALALGGVSAPMVAAPVPKDLPDRKEVEVQITPTMAMRFCWIPPGGCELGTTEDEAKLLSQRNPRPDWLLSELRVARGTVKTAGFWLGKYEVTQAQWEEVLGPERNLSYFHPRGIGRHRVDGVDTAKLPAERVSWRACQDFVSAITATAKLPAEVGAKGTFRLPTENEWEYACRGGTKDRRHFSFGQSVTGEQANFKSESPFGSDKKHESVGRTVPGGRYEKVAPHPWGLCDMHGNVAEWCQDTDGKDPELQIARGGAWSSVGLCCRAAYRESTPVGTVSPSLGLRVLFVVD